MLTSLPHCSIMCHKPHTVTLSSPGFWTLGTSNLFRALEWSGLARGGCQVSFVATLQRITYYAIWYVVFISRPLGLGSHLLASTASHAKAARTMPCPDTTDERCIRVIGRVQALSPQQIQSIHLLHIFLNKYTSDIDCLARRVGRLAGRHPSESLVVISQAECPTGVPLETERSATCNQHWNPVYPNTYLV